MRGSLDISEEEAAARLTREDERIRKESERYQQEHKLGALLQTSPEEALAASIVQSLNNKQLTELVKQALPKLEPEQLASIRNAFPAEARINTGSGVRTR
jgi:hypothetical protein